ncbi:hypothetical protein ACKKBG_A08320 [Auxenochlorella protothecoides x Auxenochlorella symbiontica]
MMQSIAIQKPFVASTTATRVTSRSSARTASTTVCAVRRDNQHAIAKVGMGLAGLLAAAQLATTPAQAFDLGQAINSVGGTDLVEKAKDAVGGSGGVQDLVQQGKDAAQNINAPDLKDAAGKVGEVADKASDKASGLADKIPGVSESNLQNVGSSIKQAGKEAANGNLNEVANDTVDTLGSRLGGGEAKKGTGSNAGKEVASKANDALKEAANQGDSFSGFVGKDTSKDKLGKDAALGGQDRGTGGLFGLFGKKSGAADLKLQGQTALGGAQSQARGVANSAKTAVNDAGTQAKGVAEEVKKTVGGLAKKAGAVEIPHPEVVKSAIKEGKRNLSLTNVKSVVGKVADKVSDKADQVANKAASISPSKGNFSGVAKTAGDSVKDAGRNAKQGFKDAAAQGKDAVKQATQ